MKVYLAGPINGCTDDEAKGWRARAAALFPDVSDPMARDYRGKEDDNFKRLVDDDKADIRAADVVLAWCDQGPPWGTAMEIMYASERHKPVLAVLSPGKTVSPWLRAHATICFSLDEAVRHALTLPINHYYDSSPR